MKKKKTTLTTPAANEIIATNSTNTTPAKRGRKPKNAAATTTTPKPNTPIMPLINSNNATILKKPNDTAIMTAAQKRKMMDPVDKDKKRKLNHASSSSTNATVTDPATDRPKVKTFARRPKADSQSKTSNTSNSNTPSSGIKPGVKVFKKRPAVEPLPLLNRSYTLSRILKGHAGDEDSDGSGNLWACEYEPTANLVALCGSNNILFLNVSLGRFVKKYTHIEPNEEFLCLAWTRLTGPKDLLDENAAEDAQCNILAAAGQLGSIKLFNTLQNECFRYLFGHHKQVRKLQFSKSKPRWLFSCSEDMSVRLWDIGPPNINDQENSSMCLAKFSLPSQVSEPSAFCITPDLSKMMVGCVQGEMLRFEMKPAEIKKLEKQDKCNDDGNEHIKNFRPKEIYPSGDEWHEGYIDDIYILGQHEQSKNPKSKSQPLDGFIVSRGSDDYETLIWDPKKSTKTDAEIAMSLEWLDSKDHAGLRFKIVEKQGDKVLLAGDYEGQIRIFNIGNDRKSRTMDDGTKELFPPTKILSHAKSSGVIRDLCISDDAKTIIAVNSANEVFIWNC